MCHLMNVPQIKNIFVDFKLYHVNEENNQLQNIC